MNPRFIIASGLKTLPRAIELVGHLVSGFEIDGTTLPESQYRAKVRSWHLPFVTVPEKAAAIVGMVREALGITRFVCHPQKNDPTGEQTMLFVRDFAAKTPPDVSPSIEIMDLPGYPPPDVLAQMVRSLREEGKNCNICLDTSHVTPPERLAIVIRTLGETIGHVHVSDRAQNERGRLVKHQFPGEGCIEWGTIMPILAEYYCGPLVIEVHVQIDESWPTRLKASIDMLEACLVKRESMAP